jgi:hypothetical protein
MPRVCVYKNLNRGCWSIAEATASGNRGKLIRHADSVTLRDVEFVVKESRRLHVVAHHCREVHAWCVGELCEPLPAAAPRREVTYSPYRGGSFTRRDGTPVHHALYVEFTDRAYTV